MDIEWLRGRECHIDHGIRRTERSRARVVLVSALEVKKGKIFRGNIPDEFFLHSRDMVFLSHCCSRRQYTHTFGEHSHRGEVNHSFFLFALSNFHHNSIFPVTWRKENDAPAHFLRHP